MEAGFSIETHPWCPSYGVFCDGSQMIQVVENPDGTVTFVPPVPPKCGREFCYLRDKSEAVIGRVEEWFCG